MGDARALGHASKIDAGIRARLCFPYTDLRRNIGLGPENTSMRRLAAMTTICLLTLGKLLAAEPVVDGLSLGPLRLVRPSGEPHGLVFLLSDQPGPTPELAQAAERLAGLGLIVAPVDLPAWLRRLDAQARDCLYLVGDLEEASRRIQAEGSRGRFLTPIVAGTGMGAAVAYATLAQAPAATIAGAAGDGFTTWIATATPLCAGAPAEPVAEGGFRYGPAALPGWWRVASTAEDAQVARAFATAAGAGSDALVVPAQGTDLGARLTRLLETPLAAETAANLAGLPLIELPVATAGSRMAVVYSGDGGWRDIDKKIAGRLQASGVPVVGVDSLRYFWSEKSPERTAADLASIVAHYRAAWSRPDITLVGYSFGADILPFAYNRLPAVEQAHVQRVSLLALSRSADFEIHVAGWLGMNDMTAGSRPIAPELARLPPGLVQCFYGAEDGESGCMAPQLKGAELIRTAGGHHFDGGYEALADTIMGPAAGP
jgi:type IV secretory pathway VirJ component